MKKTLVLFFTLISTSLLFAQEQETQPTTTFKLGGYVKADYLVTKFYNGEVKEGSLIRDFHVPGQIPIGATDVNTYGDFHVKESRFNVDIRSNKFGKPVRAFFEMDFMLSAQGNSNISNSYAPRLRHFFFEWNNILVGQTWSNFMIVMVPEELDFIGASEGVVFVRQPMVRVTKGSWAFSLENPETTVKYAESPGIAKSNAFTLPDLTARKNFSGKWGSWSIAAIGRQLCSVDSSKTSNCFGYGLTTGGKINVGSKGDDIRLVATYGSGLGRYVGLGLSASSTVSDKEIKNIETLNGYVAYNHYWTPKLCSSASFSYFEANNDPLLTGLDANKIAYSGSVNLKYKPTKDLWFGAEFSHGYREIENGDTGSFDRIQFSAKYIFGYDNFKHVFEK